MALGPAPDWTNLTWIVGDYEGTAVVVALDEDGHIVTVIQGEYEGELKTLQTDGEGYLLARIIDTADIFGTLKQMGLGELAARLGPLPLYDRRGSMVFWDNFSEGWNSWGVSASGAGYEVVLSTAKVETSPYSVKLVSGSTLSYLAGITRKLPTPTTGKLGLEAHIYTEDEELVWRVQFTHYDGTKARVFGLQYDKPNTQLEYLNNANVWTAFATDVDLYLVDALFHGMKIVGDTGTGYYVRALVDETEYDLSAYPCYTTDVTRAPYSSLVIDVTGDSGGNYTAYVDDVVFTALEPPNE